MNGRWELGSSIGWKAARSEEGFRMFRSALLALKKLRGWTDRTEPRLFHYTVGITLIRIVESGAIEPATTFVQGRETPAVWFTFRDTWEPTATKGIMSKAGGPRRDATIQEMVEATGGLVRLEVAPDRAPVSWMQHRRKGLIDLREADALERAARDRGSDPAEWRLSYTRVETTDIKVVEWSTDGRIWNPFGTFTQGGGLYADADVMRRFGITDVESR